MTHPPCSLVALFVVLAVSIASALADVTFYVAPGGSDAAAGDEHRPFATLVRARDAVRAMKEGRRLTAPVTIYLRGGTHVVAEPLTLTPDDSGTADCRITYAAVPGETPVISGGQRITGWTRGANGIWTAPVPALATGQPWTFRQLYVNGDLRQRARTPNSGFHRVAGTPDGGREVRFNTPSKRFVYAPGNLDPAWPNLRDVEVIVYHFWTDTHLLIDSVDPETRTVTFQTFSKKVFTDSNTPDGARYVVENLLGALDQPGEWFLDRHAALVHYMPMAGEDPNAADVVAPASPALLALEGDAVGQRPVEHVSFRDLTFVYARHELAPDDPNDRKQGSGNVPGAVRLAGARDVTIERCAFRNLGTFGVEIERGCSRVRVAACDFAQIGAGAVRVDGGTHAHHPLLRTTGVSIVDNHVHDYGVTYPSAVAILLMHTGGNRVAHNHIHHGFYTGISVGWSWGYQRSVARDNVIEFNHIHDIGQGLLSDMGGVYTLGVSPGTVIRNNHVHHVDAHQYGGWGIYQDEGSTGILVEKNVVHDTKFAAYMIHFAKEVTVRNNVFACGRLEQLYRGRPEPHKSVFFENNIVYWTEGTLLAKRWQDVPYTFHFHPKDATGVREESSTYDIDYNVYFNPTKSIDEVKFHDGSFGDWQRCGKDAHSVYADPQFVDAAKRDFRLKPTSPALAFGFEPIDLRDVGPRTPTGPSTRPMPPHPLPDTAREGAG